MPRLESISELYAIVNVLTEVAYITDTDSNYLEKMAKELGPTYMVVIANRTIPVPV